MRIFISGGAKNGKSMYAQQLSRALQTDKLYYVATMRACDGEDEARVLRHRLERRGWGFTTVEQPADIEEILLKCDAEGSFLLDSLTALLSNEMFGKSGEVNENALNKISNGLSAILARIKNIVIVSDYIYSDAVLYDGVTESYRKSLAALDRLTAQSCDVALEAAYGSLVCHKGKDIFAGFNEKSCVFGG